MYGNLRLSLAFWLGEERFMSSERHPGLASSQQLQSKHSLPAGITAREVRNQLSRICTSPPFRSSKRCVIFLEFVVNSVLDGRPENLKERTLGVEVFAREANYDTNQDPVVRGTASEVRKRLAQYYQIPGHELEIRIELPAGSYHPEFHLPVTPVLPVQAPQTARPGVVRSRWLWFGVTLPLVVACALLLVASSLQKHPGRSIVDQFWAPMLASSSPILVCVGQPKVYNLTGSLESEMSKRLPGPGVRPVTPPGQDQISVSLQNVVPNWDRYLAIGDATCLANVVGLLAQRNRVYHIRGGGSTTFADLRESPAVLIGGFTNDWTIRLMGHLRFTFEAGPRNASHYIYDSFRPQNRDWQLGDVWPDWKMPVDYAIVSRVLDRTTGRAIITAAGITQYGTAAAGEFLTNPDFLSQILRSAPKNWENKNLQVVLSTNVIQGTAGPPQVVATHFW
jgi:hypothetical protein